MPTEYFDLLVQSVRDCDADLQRLEPLIASLANLESFSSSRRSLKGVTSDINHTSTELRKWCDHFEREKRNEYEKRCRTEIDDATEAANWIKELILEVKAIAEDAFDTDTSARLSRDILDAVEETLDVIDRQIAVIKDLNRFNLRGKSAVQNIVREKQRRVESIRTLFEDRLRHLLPDQRKNSFCIYGERGCLGFEQLSWFWTKIPRPNGMPRARDKADRGDGILITSAHVERARGALVMFIEAWLNAIGEPLDRQSLDSMRHMPKIACVLYASGKHAHFNKFITAEINDTALLDTWEVFEAKIKDAFEDEALAMEVIAQFARVKPRSWPDGQKLILEWSEPIPLREKSTLRRSHLPVEVGVFEVEDVWKPGQLYALKVVKTGTANEGQLQELNNEIIRLTEIGNEAHGHHIVNYIKSYERGGPRSEIGMLLSPVATSNLNELLNSCCNDPAVRKQHANLLLQACGCLSYSLAYLHNVKTTRHRDVKPGNILYHQNSASGSAEFLWADFGLAFVFREQGFSGERNPRFGATPEYEAPEIDPETEGMHTRATDIFALGLVFLEIIWVLMIPDRKDSYRIGLREDCWDNLKGEYYKHHLPRLNAWIAKTDMALKTTGRKALQKLLHLAQKMIRESPIQRPKIADVVLDLWRFSHKETKEKVFCDHCTTKLKTDTSKKPLHSTIFVSGRDSHGGGPVRARPFNFGT